MVIYPGWRFDPEMFRLEVRSCPVSLAAWHLFITGACLSTSEVDVTNTHPHLCVPLTIAPSLLTFHCCCLNILALKPH